MMLAAAMALPGAARAQSWSPERSVRIVVPFAPGGASDITARLVGQALSPRLGRPVVIENKAGATTTIGAAEVARAAPDGHTLMLAPPPFVITQFAMPNLPYDPERDFRAVARLNTAPLVLGVRADLPAQTFADIVALAKARPGALTYASPGNGSLPHVATELLRLRAGIDILHVPYRGGGPATIDLAGGRVDMFLTTPLELHGQVQAGRVRIVAAATAAPLGDVPAIAATLPGYRAEFWSGFVAPRATPDAAVARLNAECNAVLAQEDVRARLAELGAEAAPGTPQQFEELLAAERRQWAEAVRAAQVRVE
jgi:tripartite-type tricarboxylate transporter receptor subunit TctC